jgi:hypothetical protein
MSVDGGANVSTKGDYTFARQLPQDTAEILTEIDKIIQIEQAYIDEEERKRAEAARIAEEKERKRIEEELRRQEEERLAQAQREEEERREQERIEQERIAAEKAERDAAERAEQERLAAEQAERDRLDAEEQARLAEERAEQERIERERQEKLAEEERKRKAKLEQERKEREERERERSEKLKAMRTEVEKHTFAEIYPEYSKNPLHVLRRKTRRLISLMRKDGKVLYEGDTTEPILAERIANEAKLRRQAEIDAARQAEMNELYEKYIPSHAQKRKQDREFKRRMKNRTYRRPAVPPIVRTREEQKAHNAEIHALFRTYHVSIFEKIKRELEEIRRKAKYRR